MDKVCPGCERLISNEFIIQKPDRLFTDDIERLWHLSCAETSLASCFRTPFSQDQDSAVEFESESTSGTLLFIAPCTFHLREVILADDGEIVSFFVGNMNMFANAPIGENSLRGKDFPLGKVPVDVFVPVGMSIILQGPPGRTGPRGLRCKLVGERKSDDKFRDVNWCHSVNRLITGSVKNKEIELVSFRVFGLTRLERLICDKWEGWEIVRVILGVDAAVSRFSAGPFVLVDRETILPTFFARAGEQFTFFVRNIGGSDSVFDARTYGIYVSNINKGFDEESENFSSYASELDLGEKK